MCSVFASEKEHLSTLIEALLVQDKGFSLWRICILGNLFSTFETRLGKLNPYEYRIIMTASSTSDMPMGY